MPNHAKSKGVLIGWTVLKAHFQKIQHNLQIVKTHLKVFFLFQEYVPNPKNQENVV